MFLTYKYHDDHNSNCLLEFYYYLLYAQAQLFVRIGGLERENAFGIMVRFRQSIYNNTDVYTTSINIILNIEH